tara:strand:- start:483 stop:1508 length:1026 start_codon:yes stop_codon:yes gene_type:complete
MKKIINWGIIGLGRASLNLAKEFKNIDNSNLLAVSSLSKEKRDFFKKEFNLNDEYIFSDYEQIIKNNDIDVIYIALPNSLHEKYCIESIKNNKNILIEKPLTFSTDSFDKIITEFKQKNILIEEGTSNKFHPFYNEVFKSLNKINFNQIKYIESSFGNDALGGKKLFNFRFKRINTKKPLFNRDLFGGSILDGGIYPVSLLVDIFNFFNENISDCKILNCKKNISKGIDIESSLELLIQNKLIRFETSLINKLDNNFKIFTDSEEMIFENIFTINSDTMVKFKSGKNINIIKNSYTKTSYHYEIKEISNLIISKDNNKKIIDKNVFKIKNNNNLISKWFEY